MSETETRTTLYLLLSEVESLVAQNKEDLQREVNQGVLKHSPEGQIQSLQSLGGMKALDDLLYTCRLRAGEFSPLTRKARDEVGEARNEVGKRLKKVVRMNGGER